jgi:hypothetical protein
MSRGIPPGMARKRSVVVKSLADPIPESAPAREKRMHRIHGFGSLSARHTCYVRELERLAFECEDYLEVLENHPDELALSYVSVRIRERIDKILEMSNG